MSLSERRLVVAATVIIASAAVARLGAQAPGRATATDGDCSLDSLGLAAAADTSHMQHRTSPLPVGESTEGGEATVYYDGGRPRVVVILYAGEMGREVVRYYLYSSKRYVVEREQLRYEVPISVQSTPHIVSRLPSVLYVCGAGTVQSLTPDDVKDIRSALDSTLALFRKKG